MGETRDARSRTAEQDAWIRRVLGYAVPATGGGRLVAVQSARLSWDRARKTVQGEVDALASAILAQSDGDEAFEAIQSGLPRLGRILEALDERLSDKLDDLYNADAGRRADLAAEARLILAEYVAFAETDPLLAAIDANPFQPVRVRASITPVLQSLARTLAPRALAA